MGITTRTNENTSKIYEINVGKIITNKKTTAPNITPVLYSSNGTFEGDKYASDKKQNVTNEMVINLYNKIKAKCKKFGISDEEIKQYVLKDVGISLEDFEKFSMEDKYKFLLNIEDALDNQIQWLKENGKIKPHVSVKASIGKSATIMYKASKRTDRETFHKYNNEHHTNIKEQLKKCSNEEEKVEIITNHKEEIKEELNKEREIELAKCGNDEARKADINAKYDELISLVIEQQQVDIYNQVEAEDAKLTVYMSEGKNYGNAVNNVMELTADEYKTQVADSFTYDFQMNVLKDFYEAGDAISAEEYGKAVEITTSYMSQEALMQFQEDAENFDSTNAPYLTQEHKNSQSAAIEKGASNNSNITAGYSTKKTSENKNATININTNFYNTNPDKIDSNRAKSQQIKQSEQTTTSLKNIESQLYVTNSLNKVLENNPNNRTDIIELVLRDRKYHVHLDDAIKELGGFSPEEKGDMIAKCSYTVIGKVLYEYPAQCRRIMDRVDKLATHDKRFLGNKKVQELTGEKVA